MPSVSEIFRCLPFFSSPPADPIPPVSAGKVSQWLRKYNDHISYLERYTADNCLYSLLGKEVESMTPILTDGRTIGSSQPAHAGIAQIVDTLVKPRLARLETSLAAAQKKLDAHTTEEKETDAGIEEKWKKLGLPSSVLENHADCARFLIESKLAFTIVGYRETCQNPQEHNLKLDQDGHPMIKKQGQWERWETLTRELHYDAKLCRIKSRDYPGRLATVWNYFHEQGLVPVDRFNWDRPFPVYELNQEGYDQVRHSALKFYETNPEKDVGIEKNCIVQFTTVEGRVMPKGWYFDNANRNYPVHIGMRVITADRKVYSFGVMMDAEELAFVFQDYFSTYLSTVDAKITMLDYQEFVPGDKHVTSIPLSGQRAQNILELISDLNKKQYRFQYMRQNCSQLMREVIQKAGYDVETRTTAKEVVYDSLPSLSQFPVIGVIDSIVRKAWSYLPAFVTRPFDFTCDVALYVPKYIATVVTNLLALKMGAGKKMTPLQDGVEDEEFYDKKKVQSFSSLTRSWADIFREETNAVYHSKFFIDWQNQQRSTFKAPYTGKPKLAIVPPAA